MICPRCGKEINDNSKYCSECGERIEEVKVEVEPEIKALSQSPVEELEKAINVQVEVTNTKHKKKKPSKK